MSSETQSRNHETPTKKVDSPIIGVGCATAIFLAGICTAKAVDHILEDREQNAIITAMQKDIATLQRQIAGMRSMEEKLADKGEDYNDPAVPADEVRAEATKTHPFPSPLPKDDIALLPEDFPTLTPEEVIKKYGFKRWQPNPEVAGGVYSSAVVSTTDFSENPQRYIHKLRKTAFNFPVGLNLTKIDKHLGKISGQGIVTINPYNGRVDLWASSIWNELDGGAVFTMNAKKFAAIMRKARLNKEEISSISGDEVVSLEPLDFLANYEGIVQLIKDDKTLTEKHTRRLLEVLREAKKVITTAFDIVHRTKIRRTEELRGYTPTSSFDIKQPTFDGVPITPSQKDEATRRILLQDTTGTTALEIEKMMPIRNIDRFKRLAAERTSEIMGGQNRMTRDSGKEIEEYSVADYIALSAYFARSMIGKYKTLDDEVKELLSGLKRDNTPRGKCTDYAGLMLQYLREYIIPQFPEKFEGWQFGIETDHIADWRHAYVKAVHANYDGSIDVFFIDPTQLSNKGIKGLRTPKDILKAARADNHPIEIVRDAEDFLDRKRKKGKRTKAPSPKKTPKVQKNTAPAK